MSALNFLQETHAEEYDGEPDYYQMLDLRAENELMRGLLRESLKVTGDGAWHRRVYAALGEEPPPVRKLKGKPPKYQRELIDAGKLAD